MDKKQVELIFAEAKCEVWKERLNEGACTFGECMHALNASKSGSTKETKNEM